MAITSYAGLLPSMMVRLPDCSADRITQALWSAGREFCTDTEAYFQRLTAINGTANTLEYTLTIPTSFDVIRVKSVHIRTAEDVTAGREGRELGSEQYTFDIADNILTFASAPFAENITSGMYVKLVLTPEENVADTSLDYDFVNRYASAIKAKALFDLFSQRHSLWYAPDEAGRWLMEYQKGVALARREWHVKGTTRELRMSGGNWL